MLLLKRRLKKKQTNLLEKIKRKLINWLKIRLMRMLLPNRRPKRKQTSSSKKIKTKLKKKLRRSKKGRLKRN